MFITLRFSYLHVSGLFHDKVCAFAGSAVLMHSVLLRAAWDGSAQAQTVRAGAVGEAALQGLAAATNYSVWVSARADAGPGPPSSPVYCTTKEDGIISTLVFSNYCILLYSQRANR